MKNTDKPEAQPGIAHTEPTEDRAAADRAEGLPWLRSFRG